MPNNTLTALTNAARWCLNERRGILTPSGKPKKPPTYWVVKCPDCGLGLTDSTQQSYKTMKEGNMKCQMRVQNDAVITVKNWTSSNPLSKDCNQPTTIIEEITA